MLAHYEGYFDNGKFYNNERQLVNIPEQYNVSIILRDKRTGKKGEAAAPEKRHYNDIGEKRRALCGCMKGKMWVSNDFDAPLDEMREYME